MDGLFGKKIPKTRNENWHKRGKCRLKDQFLKKQEF